MALKILVALAIWSWKALGPVAFDAVDTASLMAAASVSGSVPGGGIDGEAR